MTRRTLIACWALLLCGGGGAGHGVSGAGGAGGAAAPERPFDVLTRTYAPYCAPGDDLAFPMKVWGVAAGKFHFWRGTRDLYFLWCKENARDWLADSGAYVLNHGDLHLGNIGSYVRDGQALGATAFGPVDFDETARLPFQVEMLQGLVTLRLSARENKIDLEGGRREELTRELYEAYRAAVASDKGVRQLVGDDQKIGKFIEQLQKHSYDRTLEKFTRNGHFKSRVHSKNDALKEVLRPAGDRADAVAAGLAQALQNSPAARAAFRYADVASIRKGIKDVALRTRMESVGSQGLRKILVLMDRPLKGLDMDVVLYLKQEIPAAAERAGAIPKDPRRPGRRCSEDMNKLTNPSAYLNTWCEMGEESYWVSFKEPWSEELESDKIGNYAELLNMAKVWGSVAGTMHRLNGDPKAILARLDRPALFGDLQNRASAFLRHVV
jgi:uncharacterized protein (DUF2252 family)